jgi:hypothetical protein
MSEIKIRKTEKKLGKRRKMDGWMDGWIGMWRDG